MLLKTITWVRWVAFMAAVGLVVTLVTGCANGQERPSELVSTSRDSERHGPQLALASRLLSEVERSPSANLEELRDKLRHARAATQAVLAERPQNAEALKLSARIDGLLAVLQPRPRDNHDPRVAEAEATLDRLEGLVKGGGSRNEVEALYIHLREMAKRLETEKPAYAARYRKRAHELWAFYAGSLGNIPDVCRGCAPELLHATASGGITAHFGGEKPPSDLDVPLEFGVTALWFTFPGDQSAYVFKPSGTLYFSDWRFDIFSPDGAHVLLLQDRFGPYHVVKTDRLKDYLLGTARPDHVVTGARRPDDPARVHSEGRWVSPKEIRFTAACCGTREMVTYRLP